MTRKIAYFVRQQFIKLWLARGKPDFIVEKTCANSLRVPFVRKILPEARFIHLVRNGFDVIASAEKRWQGDFELPKAPYFLSKARYTPIRDLPIYAFRFLQSRLTLITGRTRHLGFWGPSFDGMSSLSDTTLVDLCALQWMHCVEHADNAFSSMTNRVVEARYELLTREPHQVVRGILTQVAPDMVVKDSAIDHAISGIRAPVASKAEFVAPRLSSVVHDRVVTKMVNKGYEEYCR